MAAKFKRLFADAKMPTRAHKHDAGIDLYAYIDGWTHQDAICIWPGERKMIPVGVAVEIDQGYYGQIASKSGLAIRQGLVVIGGVIDSEYRGQIMVLLHNIGEREQIIDMGDKVAQLIIIPCALPEVVEGELSDTERGSNGFGSTGK